MSVLLTPPFSDPMQVTSANRSTVRKWLRDCGVPSSITEHLIVRELREAIENPAAKVAELIERQPDDQQRKPR